MTRRSRSPQKPHARKKATREKAVVSTIDPDQEWADDIWQRLLAGCHPFQYDAATDPSRRISYLVGRGGSKTTTFRIRAIRRCTAKARAKVIYFARTRMRAKDLFWFPLKALLYRLGLEVGKDVAYHESELRCTFLRTGSMIQLSGLEDTAEADKWRGDTWDEVQLDECGAIKPELLEYTIYQVIGPRVRCIVLGGTPGRDRRGPFYEHTRPGSPTHRPYRERKKHPDWQGYSSHHWDLETVMALPGARKKWEPLAELWDMALVEKAANGWSDDNPIWLREYKAVWAADNTLRVFGDFQPYKDGQEWNIWDPFEGRDIVEGVAGLRVAAKKLRERFPEFTDWRFVDARDMGTRDEFACSVLAFSPHDPQRRIWQVMSFERVGMYAKPIAELLLGAEYVDRFLKTGQAGTDYGGVYSVTGWPDASVMDSDHATLDELKNVYGIQTKKADKKPDYKAGAFELVNGDFHEGRIKVLKGSPMHRQLEQLQWKENDNGKLVEDPAQANHSTDTLVYGRQEVATLFQSGQVASDPKQPDPGAYKDPMGLEVPEIGTELDTHDEEGLMPASEWDEDDDWL